MQLNQTLRVARTTAPQTLNPSSTTLQNVTELVASVEASKTYKFRLTLYVTGKADADVKVTATGPASSTGLIDLVTVNPGINPLGTAVAVSLADDTLSQIVMEGLIVVSTTAGDLQIQAAQNASEADSLIVAKGSVLEIFETEDIE